MRLKTLDASLLALMILPMMFVGFANAIPPFPNLPSGTVNLTVSFYQDEDQYDIISILSNVPSGFDVINGAYTGWCVDYRGNGIPTSDPVYLYSSIDLPAIAPLHMQDWNRINYIKFK